MAVCHLTEVGGRDRKILKFSENFQIPTFNIQHSTFVFLQVCIYSLEGKLKRRFEHDKFGSCWGITCDVDGEFAFEFGLKRKMFKN